MAKLNIKAWQLVEIERVIGCVTELELRFDECTIFDAETLQLYQ
jgi:hypothetical protein